ncbi:hypothetical protein [uncultured Methylophaga sp.]|uniref:hypothetical protein n=1 Tax=uncultured Methylophaga sp. TaxID=285271 RepID=UPI002638991B|nr:hypothetical protein [uncultured Methylophaga sp.]
MDDSALEEYLLKLNSEFSSSGLEHKKRPWEALRRYSTDHNVSVSISSSTADRIFKWFEKRSKPGANEIGSLFNSVYFYDGEFWDISIPLSYGRVQLNALDSLAEMPSPIKAQLMNENNELWKYTIFWADCVDYAHGLEDLTKTGKISGFGKELLFAGSQELKTAIQLLSQNKPDPRSILNSRMAVEIFIKSFIALKIGLSQSEAKSLGHNLVKGLKRFVEVSGYEDFMKIEKDLKIFPRVEERYKEQSLTRGDLWLAFTIAQSFGTIVAREFTGRNTLEQVFSHT